MTNVQRHYTCHFLILNILFTLLVMQYICQGWGTRASCQCLIPSWICLSRTHAWRDMVRVWRRCLFHVAKNFQPRQPLLALAAGSLCHLMWKCDIRGACAQTFVSHARSLCLPHCNVSKTTTGQHLVPRSILPRAIFSHYSGLKTGVSVCTRLYADALTRAPCLE